MIRPIVSSSINPAPVAPSPAPKARAATADGIDTRPMSLRRALKLAGTAAALLTPAAQGAPTATGATLLPRDPTKLTITNNNCRWIDVQVNSGPVTSEYDASYTLTGANVGDTLTLYTHDSGFPVSRVNDMNTQYSCFDQYGDPIGCAYSYTLTKDDFQHGFEVECSPPFVSITNNCPGVITYSDAQDPQASGTIGGNQAAVVPNFFIGDDVTLTYAGTGTPAWTPTTSGKKMGTGSSLQTTIKANAGFIANC